MAIVSGEIDVPVDIDPASLYNAVYSGPVMPWIDPDKRGASAERAHQRWISDRKPRQYEQAAATRQKLNADVELRLRKTANLVSSLTLI